MMAIDSKVIDGVTQVARELYEKHGEIQTSALVDAARPKTSPAHNGFEWNDKKAAEEHRLYQARHWIRKVTIIIEDREEKLIHVPSIHSETMKEGGYKPISVIVKKPDEFERALQEAISKLHAARRAVDTLRNAADQEPTDARATMIAQVSRGLEILEGALQMQH